MGRIESRVLTEIIYTFPKPDTPQFYIVSLSQFARVQVYYIVGYHSTDLAEQTMV